MRKNFSHSAIQICQNQGFISSPFSEKNTIIFCNIWAIFVTKQGGVSSQRARIKTWQILFHSHDSLSTSCKKILVPAFSSFVAIDHKGHFRKILTWIFKFGCFSWYHANILEKNELGFLMKNLMLNRMAPISNPKNEKVILDYLKKTVHNLFTITANIQGVLWKKSFETLNVFFKHITLKYLFAKYLRKSSFFNNVEFIHAHFSRILLKV